jgi:hypothetical protein
MLQWSHAIHEIIYIDFRTDVSKLRHSNIVYTFVLYRYVLQCIVLCTEAFMYGCLRSSFFFFFVNEMRDNLKMLVFKKTERFDVVLKCPVY